MRVGTALGWPDCNGHLTRNSNTHDTHPYDKVAETSAAMCLGFGHGSHACVAVGTKT